MINEKAMPTREEFEILASLCYKALAMRAAKQETISDKEKFVAALVAGNAGWTIKFTPELLERFGH